MRDEYFGESRVFKRDFAALLELQRAPQSAAAARAFKLHAVYQGCAEDGICYAPVSQAFTVELPGAAAQNGGVPAAAGARRPHWGLLIGAVAGGLMLTFTPCVLPMLPILFAVIAGRRRDSKKPLRGGVLALAYVAGTIATYAVIGAVAGFSGAQLQAYFQNPWAIGVLAAVLTGMALSQFGLFSLQTPAFLQAAMRKTPSKNARHTLPAAFALGAGSALIVGACVSPLLISFLGLAIAAADPLLGAQLMMAMALGMGLPMLALGFGAHALLPRPGRWLESINRGAGIALIAVAIYLLGALPAVPILFIWGVFFIALGVYLCAMLKNPRARLAGKLCGGLFLAWGTAALVGGGFGERDVLRPLPAELFAPSAARISAEFIPIATPAELDAQFAYAVAANKFVLVEYYADWCVDCVRMEKTTFRDPTVARILREKFIAVRIDVTDPRDVNGIALKKRFGVFGPPATLFFDRNGAALRDKHFYGYRGPAAFIQLLATL